MICNSYILSILITLGSFFIGFLGSGAYILAVKVGFAGGNTEKERNFTFKKFNKNFKNCLCYMFFGGFFAGVLQIVTPNVFVPFQSLITGITWPSVVSGLLSGKQAGRSEKEIDFSGDPEKKEEVKELLKDLREIKNIAPQKILKETESSKKGVKKDGI